MPYEPFFLGVGVVFNLLNLHFGLGKKNTLAAKNSLKHWRIQVILVMFTLGPAKTYILRGTPRTHAIQIRAVTENQTIEKGPRKGNRGPVRGTDGCVKGTKGPVRGTGGHF